MYDDTPSDGRGFNEDGSLREVENARQAVTNDSPVLGIAAEDGVVLVAYDRSDSSLQVTDDNDNPRSIGDIGVVSVGNEADATTLFNATLEAVREEYLQYGEAANGEFVSETMANRITQTTQDLEQRPLGAAFLVGDGTDGTLRLVDVDGSVRQWRARAVGQRSTQLNQYLEDHYEAEGFHVEDALAMAMDGLERVMGSLSTEGISALIVTDDGPSVVGENRLNALR